MADRERKLYPPDLTINDKVEITDKIDEKDPSFTKNIRISGKMSILKIDEDYVDSAKKRISIDVFNKTLDRKIYSEPPTTWDADSGEWSYDKAAQTGTEYIFEVRGTLHEAWAEKEVKVEGDAPAKEEIIWPTDVHVVTSGHGPRNGPNGSFHKGIDIGAPNDAPIYAALGGEVIENRWFTAGGWSVAIYNAENNLTTVYMHMKSKSNVSGTVSQRQIIGNVGNTGGGDCRPPITYGYHLHFEIRKGRDVFGSTHENPLNYLP